MRALAALAEAAGREKPARRLPPNRPAACFARGGPEGKLRGRPPPPVEPRSGPWRRTGSESIAGRARTRQYEYAGRRGCRATCLQVGNCSRFRELLQFAKPAERCRLRRRGIASISEL